MIKVHHSRFVEQHSFRVEVGNDTIELEDVTCLTCLNKLKIMNRTRMERVERRIAEVRRPGTMTMTEPMRIYVEGQDANGKPKAESVAELIDCQCAMCAHKCGIWTRWKATHCAGIEVCEVEVREVLIQEHFPGLSSNSADMAIIGWIKSTTKSGGEGEGGDDE